MTKSKWKKLVKTKIEEKANEIYEVECEKLKKLNCLNLYKTKIKPERYMDILEEKQASKDIIYTNNLNDLCYKQF